MTEMWCELDRAVGLRSRCPGESCSFWTDSHCVLAGLRADWDANPSLASLLQSVRQQLTVPNGRSLVPPGLRD